MPTADQRLIEDYIPIEAISAEARREKSIRKGHIATLHLWWARRPLVAARAAVYGVLAPAPKDKRGAQDAAEFVTELCKYPGSPSVIAEARRRLLEAHAERLTAERVGLGCACPSHRHHGRHRSRPRTAAPRAGHVRRRRCDPAGGVAARL